MSKDKEKYRQRNDIRLVNNEMFNDRFFKACQVIKDGRYMEQQVNIIAWKAYRRGGMIAMNEECALNITGLVMTAQSTPPISEYIKVLNEHGRAGINDDGDVTVMLTMEMTYLYRGK